MIRILPFVKTVVRHHNSISPLTLWPSKVLRHLALRVAGPAIIGRLSPNSHILIDLSRLPLTRDRPLGAKATEYTLSLWPSIPSSRSIRNPFLASQTLTLLSRDPAATYSPPGEMATVVTPSSMARLSTSCPLSISHTRTVRSPLPDAMCFPLRAKSSE